MKREIKFRAIKDDMSNAVFVYGQLIYSADGAPRITNDGGVTFHTCLKGTEWQYVGLHDKNGEEVYEGDILAFDPLLNWLVIFQNGCFGIRNVGQDGYMNHAEFHRIDSPYFFNDRTVIGNIHQHSSLLTPNTDEKAG